VLVLGLDPGSRHAGFGLVERVGGRVRSAGCGRISPDPKLPPAERLAALAAELELLIERERPDCAAVERVFHGVNSRSLIVLAEARGALLAVLGRHRLPVVELAPAAIKSAVAGSGRADKRQVARMVALQLGMTEAALPADATDALAAALCFALGASRLAGAPEAPRRGRK
jgi:crossover junction endodeoxyribonuclease RuvC